MTTTTTAAPAAGGGSVHLVGPTLAMVGDVDRAVIRAATQLTPPAVALADVTTVDLTAATHLDVEALHLMLRCLQATQRRRPPARLRVDGADQPTRDQLQLLGVLPLLELHA